MQAGYGAGCGTFRRMLRRAAQSRKGGSSWRLREDRSVYQPKVTDILGQHRTAAVVTGGIGTVECSSARQATMRL
jgi:hypothetical protein